jgi:hypothetical protein
MRMTQVAPLLLLGFVVPVWMLAGFVDYLCHRSSRIEDTAGAKESALHFLQFAEVGAAVLACLLLEVNAAVLLFCVAMLVVHEATAYWDISYAITRRRVTPVEQMAHSFLEIMPLAGLLLLLTLRWPEVLGLLGWGSTTADFSLRATTHPLPAWYLLSLALGVTLLAIVPFGDEMARCLRAARNADRRKRLPVV